MVVLTPFLTLCQYHEEKRELKNLTARRPPLLYVQERMLREHLLS